ncbi:MULTISPECIES: hypothetical protein [Streptomyces]|uniref:hypothetical protein n=1 Tax=Streptomyces TaxID=1883 RepID=UPI001FE9F4D9|nr:MULTISPECIES: hypothetical protein [Streptomyces]
MTSPEARGPKLPPTHPPRTPPPQKKPVEAPRPQPATKPKEVAVRARPRMVVRNRRTAALVFRADRWAAGKAARQAVETVRGWGYAGACEGDVEQSVRVLVGAAVADGGKRLSVHLGDQEGKILVAVLSHVVGAPDDGVLAQVAGLAATCAVGTDTGEDGRRMWAVLDTAPRRPRTAPGAPGPTG